jgi:predicted 3-demethylubiquinone-9 3-methyltransferase (glyoxalase superfamily)
MSSRILGLTRYAEAGQEAQGRPPGSVMTVAFELAGQGFTALNGGPLFRFNEAISLQVLCDTQAEIDHYWDRLTAGGDPKAQQCGWLKDQFGVSWQVVPRALPELLADDRSEHAQRVMSALMQMQKLDLAALRRAYEGEPARR